MKYIFFLLLITSCSLFINEKLIFRKILNNGTVLELYYTGGGATDSDIIWIKKVTKDGRKTRIGKIKDFTVSDKVNVIEVDSNHVALSFVVSYFPQHPVIFLIDLNNKIERNDGSPFNKPE